MRQLLHFKLTELSFVSVGGFMHGRMLQSSSDDLTSKRHYLAFQIVFLSSIKFSY